MSEWRSYILNGAPKDALCVFRDSTEPDKTWVGYSRDFHPLMNVAYLEWKLTGIAQEAGHLWAASRRFNAFNQMAFQQAAMPGFWQQTANPWGFPTQIFLGNGSVRMMDDLDRRIQSTPQSQWTAEMLQRISADQSLRRLLEPAPAPPSMANADY